uniref:Uncharacterized protein n=1 Tax=Tanacetum cinerariifolium TaxID=118510 RepID=A0A6L2L7B8_TANCI|nr:hypothetical protein [Tanacetum cinerariifolium]
MLAPSENTPLKRTRDSPGRGRQSPRVTRPSGEGCSTSNNADYTRHISAIDRGLILEGSEHNHKLGGVCTIAGAANPTDAEAMTPSWTNARQLMNHATLKKTRKLNWWLPTENGWKKMVLFIIMKMTKGLWSTAWKVQECPGGIAAP